jgi:hypothetical protein
MLIPTMTLYYLNSDTHLYDFKYMFIPLGEVIIALIFTLSNLAKY